jgi:hypothetical protein
MPATDATSFEYAALDAALHAPAAMVRAATDLVKDPWADVILAAMRAYARPEHCSATAAGPDPSPSIADAGPRLSGMAPWLVDTIAVIDTHRKAAVQSPQQDQVLDTAEMLASFLADIDQRRRPQLNIDAEGQPSFATSLDDFYIHLTVDEPNLLTWYSTVRGAEHFNERVVFDGRRLPTSLKHLFSM